MVRRSLILAVGSLLVSAGVATAGGPVNPHGSGKEPTPVEREFHLAIPADAPLTEGVPQRPRRLAENEVWTAVRLLLPWTRGM